MIAVKTHVGVDAVRRIRSDWERLQYHPNSDLDHCLLVCRLRPEVIDPWALSVWDGDHCRAIIAGRLERNRLRPRIGYANLPGVHARELTIVHEGILGELDDEASLGVVGALFQTLKDGHADLVSLNSVPERFAGIWAALGRRRRQTVGAFKPGWRTHRVMTVENDPGFLWKSISSKSRNTMKRKERRFMEAFPTGVKWIWCAHVDDLQDLCKRIESVACTTYQRGLGVGFINNDEVRQRLALFAESGQVRVGLLEVNSQPIAFWLGTLYRGVFHSGALGYKPEVESYGVGNLLFFRTVEELAREGVGRLDFGQGDAEYKERFGDLCWREADVRLFGHSLKSHLLRIYLGGTDVIDRFARRAFGRLGVFARIKQAWRTRLRNRQSSQAGATD